MQTKTLQIIPNGVMPRVNASQYDNGREVHFLLFDGSTSYTPPAGATIRVEGTKKDGNGFSYDCAYSGNDVTVEIKTQMTVFDGEVLCELRISKDDTDIGTLNFILAVEKAGLSEDIPISDTEIPAIINLARDEQYNAEAWAKGTKDGIPVPADDPAYHNSAKWWAEHSQGGRFANLLDVDVDNPQSGQVPVYNSTTQMWENGTNIIPNPQEAATENLNKVKINNTVYNIASGGLLPHLYIDSEAGSTVTVITPDSQTITPTQISSGHWECDVPDYGVYTIHAVLNGDDAVITLTVDDVKEYHITDNHFSYTLSVYAPTGSTIRITDGVSETYTGTGAGSTAVTFGLHQASTTYTIQVTLDGVSKSDSVTTPSATGGSGSKTFEYGTINVTLDADFIGETITCVNGGTTISKTASSTSLVFYPPTTGTWSISGTISGTTYSVDAEVVDLSTPVSVSLETLQTVTVTLYSATEDTVTFTDASGVQKTEVFATGQSSKSIDITIQPNGQSITFTSSVAKNPDDLSQYYSKALTVTTNTTELYLMPDAVKTLYWWGYEGDDLQVLSSANGWSVSFSSSYGFVDPTFNSNNIQVTGSSGKVQGVGNKTALSITKIHSIAKQTSNDATYGLYVLVAGNKAITGGNTLNFNTPNTLQYKSTNVTGSYVAAHRVDNRSGYYYALWYE